MGLFTDKSGKWIGFTDRMKYVEDFRTELIEKENGKIVKKVTYLGEWTVLNDTGARTLWKLISAAVSAVLTGGFLAWGLLTTHASSGSFLVVIPLVMALFPALYLLFGAASLPYRRNPMRRDQVMHGITRMQRSSVAVIVFAGAAILMSILYRIINKDWAFFKEDWLFLVRIAAAIICCIGILVLLGSIETRQKPNDAFPNEQKLTRF